ncbi:polysaccharide pyruvyl transferase family protein [Microbacterium resistens]|uniref:Polysaccharide pyruvyl transferase family protein n=1 Tax=Microbacterium resistens TaxID=156977 RepID=A0ABY3RU12_9MICO|nr:polysaccharide pyruvyl transferase family protein [Microbacterium resistens]UGS26389.1 polysaccharide pyruvyl transferase family protein [Microbacterium resistens]
MPDQTPNVVAVGAYERDNFGDMLYAELVDQLVGSRAKFTFAAPFARDMTRAFGRDIPAVAPLLDRGPVDAIWTVGGEVGTAELGHAYRTAFGENSRAFNRMTPEQREEVLFQATGTHVRDSAYMPRPSSHRGSADAAFVLNSVGLSAISRIRGARRAALDATLHEATFISVRDARSHDFLSSAGIEHIFVPDLAHLISEIHSPKVIEGRYALIQVPEFAVRGHGVEIWAEAIADSLSNTGLGVRFFMAGTAPGHDTVTTAERLAEVVGASLGDDVHVSEARGVWPRVDEIANASLWLGGSLHGRIISSAYGVPRVSIGSRKTDAYAASWDPTMPFGATPETLGDAVTAAITTKHDAKGSASLASQARSGIERALAHVVDFSGRSRTDIVAARLQYRVDEVEALRRIAQDQERQLNATK